jgi:hypothetical protein
MTDSAQFNNNIELHIKELVLEGFPTRDTSRIVSVFKSELEQLLRQGNIPENIRSKNILRLDGGTIRIQPGASPEMSGRQVARNLYRGLVQ